MTEIYFGEKAGTKQIRISGHAGYAPKGADIVCAGISALIQSYSFYLEDLCEKGLEYVYSDSKDGYIDIVCSSEMIEAETAYEITRNGLEAMADSYPEYVHVSTGNNIF